MKRKHIPILVKVMAARHQLKTEFDVEPPRRQRGLALTIYLERDLIPMLEARLGKPLQLDHDPALGLRQHFKNGRGEVVRMVPAELDWRHMRYSQTLDHLQKTVGRKPGAEKTVTTKGSDIWKMKKFRRLEGPAKRKARIPSRPFPKQRSTFR